MTVVHTSIAEKSLDPSGVEAEVWSKEAGAVVIFSGIVRDHDGGKAVQHLSYTSHPSAADMLADIAEAVSRTHPGVRIWAAHRVGELGIGDHALVAGCASAHRAEAFTACAELVERIKAEVPIWKKQFYSDGTKDWVGIT